MEYTGGEHDEDEFYMTPKNPCESLPFASRGHTDYGMSQCGYSLDVEEVSMRGLVADS